MADDLSRWQATYRNHLPYSAESPVIREIHSRLSDDVCQSGSSSLSAEQISQLINTVFWASLATEEGQYAKISVTIMEPENLREGVVLTNQLALSASVLVKLSPVSQKENCYIAVSCKSKKNPAIWGLLTHAPVLQPLIRAKEPGTVVVSNGGENLAYLSPVGNLALPGIPNWVLKVAGFLGPAAEPRFEMAWFLRFLAEAMQHGRGGTILVVPGNSDNWRESVKGGYSISSDKLDIISHAERWKSRSEETRAPERPFLYLDPVLAEATKFRKAVALVGGLTAVDGATVINNNNKVVCFGVKIKPREEPPEEISVADVLGSAESYETILFRDIGGTRHQSAASFANEHPGTLALVTSQDGRMTIFQKTNNRLWALRRCETLLPDS